MENYPATMKPSEKSSRRELTPFENIYTDGNAGCTL
jgi:hypothetical protein